MSHELRTPLNGVMGYAQILHNSKTLAKKDRDRVDMIYRCASDLLTLINDVLDLSKIEAQRMELYPTEFHFRSFLQSVIEMFRLKAELKNISFCYQSVGELPAGFRADEKRLRQVLINLLGNAIKFTDEGWDKIQIFCPQLVITDLVMPIMDGLKMIELVRASENWKDIVIIAASAK